MDGGAWWAAIYGVAQSWTRLKRLSSSSSSRERKQRRKRGEEEREGGKRKRKESRNLPMKNKSLSLPVVQLPSNPVCRLLLSPTSSPSAWPHRDAHLSPNTASVSSSRPSDPLSHSHLTPNCSALELEKLKHWIYREFKISESNSFI